MSTDKEVFQALKALARDIRAHIRAPNAGGCCVIAAEAGLRLPDRFAPALRISDWAARDRPYLLHDAVTELAAENVQCCKDWHDYGISFVHVMLSVQLADGLYQWDSHGPMPYQDRCGLGYRCYTDTLPLNIGYQLAQDDRGWNSSFNRGQIPLVQKLCDKHLEKIT